MRELIIKDLRLHKRYLAFLGIFFPLYMGYIGSRLNKTGIFAVFGAILYATGPLMLFTREDKFKSLAFGLSLPATRREVLASRYVFSWALMGLFYFLGAVVAAAVPGSKFGAAGFRPGMVLAALGLMTLYFGSLLPLTVRFGPIGIIVFMVILQVLGIAAMSLPTRAIQAFAGAVKAALSAARGALGPAGSAAALIVGMVLLNLASFGLALRLFERKDY